MRFLFLLSFITLSLASVAQMPKSQKAIIKVPGVQCEICKQTIESRAPKYLDGLIKMNVNFKAKTVQVQWHPDRTNIEEIKTAIANAGYDADDVSVNPDSYKSLPKTCKKAEDGGGHKPEKKPE